jgi:hypothetical protein
MSKDWRKRLKALCQLYGMGHEGRIGRPGASDMHAEIGETIDTLAAEIEAMHRVAFQLLDPRFLANQEMLIHPCGLTEGAGLTEPTDPNDEDAPYKLTKLGALLRERA